MQADSDAAASQVSAEKSVLFRGIVRGLLPLFLLSLLGEKDRYGGEIMATFAEMSGGRWRPSPGSVYPLLKKLERDGLIAGTWESGRAAAKRVYAITPAGREELPRLQRRLLSELRVVKGVVDQHIAALEAIVTGAGSWGDWREEEP